MGNTINKHFHIYEDYWQRLEKAANERRISSSWLVIKLAM